MSVVTNRPQVREAIFTRDFLLVCFASIAMFAGMAFLMPVLPLYVMHVGGSRSDIGPIIAAFALTAVVVRPFLGRETDRRGPKVVLVAGVIILALASALYLVVSDIPLLLALRVLHGVGMGAATMAVWVLVADYAPPHRRGEAMGYFGMFLSASFAFGPLVGTGLVEAGGFLLLFAVLTVITAFSLGFVLPLREPPREANGSNQQTPPLFARSAFLPALVFFCVATTFAPIGGFLPLLVQDRGMGLATAGLFFSIQAGAIFLSRILGGKLSDQYGRNVVVLPSMGVIIAGVVLLAFAASPALLFLAAVVHGFGVGTVQPALLALAVDRAPESERGAAMATVTSAMDLGFGVMAIPLGILLEVTDFTTVYLAAGSVALLGMLFFAAAVYRAQNARQPEAQKAPAA